ncbi:hypothetical protein EDC19_1398 [Natranaerovirga hydrolytica]|uniref:Uncharacterized protein n=1 Tax=Natranaerovirga hydrolytica TaxID=680378 RepID=A0A4R1MKW5_9FIRM|nr:hypothetical protein [Natranaerovirga hydrolytica]TCK93207.1 hypothetical protein EDC19_1398 [Natranaerovirga hydrolytica]
MINSVINAIESVINNMYQWVNQSDTNELQKVVRDVNFTGGLVNRKSRLNEILPSINILIGYKRITGLLHDKGRRSFLVDLYELGEALEIIREIIRDRYF